MFFPQVIGFKSQLEGPMVYDRPLVIGSKFF
jgi:hypothetical protein